MKTIKDLTNLTVDNCLNKIVYAPNSAGKTRLSKKINEAISKNKATILLTSDKIEELITFSGKHFNIGFESKEKVENESIEKLYSKTKITNIVFKDFGASKTSDLVKNSYAFSKLNLSKKQDIEFYSEFLKNCKTDNITEIGKEAAVEVCKKITQQEIDIVQKIINDKRTVVINQEVISNDTKQHLEAIKESIDKNRVKCPLCGNNYDDNEILMERINNYQSSLTVDNNEDKNVCIKFINKLSGLNKQYDLDFDVEYRDEINVDILSQNIDKLIKIKNALLLQYVNQYNQEIPNSNYQTYINNKSVIEKEERKRKNQEEFLAKALESIKKIINLPFGYDFYNRNNQDIFIKNINENTELNPKDFLSDSELRRMCIAILSAEINCRDIQCLILDDPVDSNDDYYFSASTFFIIDMINEKKDSIQWIVFTHEIRFLSLVCQIEDFDCKYLLCLPDPSIADYSKIKYTLIGYEHSSELRFINNHEIMMFGELLGQSDVDNDLLLLSVFNPIRTLNLEILRHRNNIVDDEFKKLLDKCSDSYEHYPIDSNIATMKDLGEIVKNEFINYKNNPNYDESCFAYRYRIDFLKKEYSCIKCKNEVQKHILYIMIRVMNDHFLFEEKLYNFLKSGYNKSFDSQKFQNSSGIWNKISYAKDITKNNDRLNKMETVYRRWKHIFNDFAHGLTRSYSPYLAISPVELLKLENDIKDC